MFKLLVLLLSLIVSAAVAQQQIRHLQVNDAQLIDTSSNHYALAGDELGQLSPQDGWKTISVNDDGIKTWSANCQTKDMNLYKLSDQVRALVVGFRNKLDNVVKSSGFGASYSSSSFSLDGSQTSSMSSGSQNSMNSQSMNGVQVTTIDGPNSGQYFSISRPGLPSNLARLFSTDQLTTFVYRNGTVQMKPSACLSTNEQQLVEQLKVEVQKFRDNSRRLKIDFDKNMQEMQTNLNQNFDSMRRKFQIMNQNMNNMHGGQQQQQSSWQYGKQPVAQDGTYPSHSIVPYGGPYNPNGSGFWPFGQNFPFGPNNSPFGPGFPFNR